MRMLRLGSLLMLFSLLLAACAPSEVTAEEIMERMQAARENLQTAHAIADVSLESPDQNGTFTIEGWVAKTGETDAAGQPIGKSHITVLQADSDDERSADLVGTELVNDGETFWLYNPAENTVLTGDLSELKGDDAAGDPAAQMMQLQDMLQQILDGSDVVVESQSEQVAGRDTWKVRLTPNAETTEQMQLGSVIDTRLWIDKESDLPVKAEIDAGDMGRVEATATTLELNQPIADSVFTFTPPADADVIDANELAEKARPQVTSLEEARAAVSFPVLSPSALPDGVQLDEVQVLQLRGESVVQNFSGAINFSLVQSKGGFPGDDQAPAGAETEQVEVRGQDATLITSGAGDAQGTLLRWQEGDVTIVIAGTLSADQATAIAGSLE